MLGREAVASVPPDRAAMGSGANNTARYLGAAVGITLFVTIATHVGDLVLDGWNVVILVCVGVSLVGAAVIALVGRSRGRDRAAGSVAAREMTAGTGRPGSRRSSGVAGWAWNGWARVDRAGFRGPSPGLLAPQPAWVARLRVSRLVAGLLAPQPAWGLGCGVSRLVAGAPRTSTSVGGSAAGFEARRAGALAPQPA